MFCSVISGLVVGEKMGWEGHWPPILREVCWDGIRSMRAGLWKCSRRAARNIEDMSRNIRGPVIFRRCGCNTASDGGILISPKDFVAIVRVAPSLRTRSKVRETILLWELNATLFRRDDVIIVSNVLYGSTLLFMLSWQGPLLMSMLRPLPPLVQLCLPIISSALLVAIDLEANLSPAYGGVRQMLLPDRSDNSEC